MKIKKTFQGSLPENKILNSNSTSQTDTYSCEKINEMTDNKWKLLGTITGLNSIDLPDNFDEILVVVKANNMIFEHHLYKEFMGSEELTQITSGYAYEGERNFSQLFFTNTSIRKSGCQVSSTGYNDTQVSYVYYK